MPLRISGWLKDAQMISPREPFRPKPLQALIAIKRPFATECRATSYRAVNRRLDGLALPHGVNERQLEAILAQLEAIGRVHCHLHWLALARLTEAALLCAGHYADNCEAAAAGDLLINPRRILFSVDGSGRKLIKARHGRLSDQLAVATPDICSLATGKGRVSCEIAAAALLPDLHGRLSAAGFFSRAYLEDVARRLVAVADTIRFLAAWQIDANEVLHQRVAAGDAAGRKYIEDHLCRFDDVWFRRFGLQIDQIQCRPRRAILRPATGAEPARFRREG